MALGREDEANVDPSSSICCGLARSQGPHPMQMFFRPGKATNGSANATGGGSRSRFFGAFFTSATAPAAQGGNSQKDGPKETDTGAGMHMHNQVAPITAEPTKEQQQKAQILNGIKKVTPRVDGWSEADIKDWEPNDYEKDLVKRTWSDDFDFLYELGSAIYTYIFEHNPHTKELFPKIHQHGDNWKDSADFRSQALKFVQTISYVAKNLYHMEECLQPRLFAIGEHHVQYAARGFKPEYWDIFLDAMEFSLTNHIQSILCFTEEQKADATKVWRRLAHYIIVHMKQGYQAEERRQKK